MLLDKNMSGYNVNVTGNEAEFLEADITPGKQFHLNIIIIDSFTVNLSSLRREVKHLREPHQVRLPSYTMTVMTELFQFNPPASAAAQTGTFTHRLHSHISARLNTPHTQ